MPYKDYRNRNASIEMPFKEIPRLVQVGFEHETPGWYNVEHSHSACELVYLTKGQESAIINEKRYEVSAGEVVIINSKMLHQEWANATQIREAIICTFDSFQIENLPQNCLIDEEICPVIHLSQNKEQIDHCFHFLLEESRKEGPYNYYLISLIMQQILVLLFRNIKSEKKKEKDFLKECNIVISYIEEHYKEQITLDDLAKQVFISKGHLSHIFRAQMGEAPIQYLIRKRMEEAKKLLVKTDLTISEVALEVGYENPVYFSQIFNKETGVSPMKYRRNEKLKV